MAAGAAMAGKLSELAYKVCARERASERRRERREEHTRRPHSRIGVGKGGKVGGANEVVTLNPPSPLILFNWLMCLLGAQQCSKDIFIFGGDERPTGQRQILSVREEISRWESNPKIWVTFPPSSSSLSSRTYSK